MDVKIHARKTRNNSIAILSARHKSTYELNCWSLLIVECVHAPYPAGVQKWK